MDKRKITRRVALGVAVGGLAASPLIISYLRQMFRVNLPSGGGTDRVILEGSVTTTVEGVKVGPIKIPPMEIRTPEDRKRYAKLRDELVAKAVESDPRVAKAREAAREKAWEENKEKRIAQYRAERTRELEGWANKELEKVGNSSLGEQEKARELERIKNVLASRKEGLEKALQEAKNEPGPPKLRVPPTEDQRKEQRERIAKSVEASVRRVFEKHLERKQISAEEKERIIQERTREAVEAALKRLENLSSTQPTHD